MNHPIPTIPVHDTHAADCPCSTYTPRLSCCAARAVSDAAAPINDQPRLTASERAGIAIHYLAANDPKRSVYWLDAADIIAYFASKGGPL